LVVKKNRGAWKINFLTFIEFLQYFDKWKGSSEVCDFGKRWSISNCKFISLCFFTKECVCFLFFYLFKGSLFIFYPLPYMYTHISFLNWSINWMANNFKFWWFAFYILFFVKYPSD
jgi:hypothetical protein